MALGCDEQSSSFWSAYTTTITINNATLERLLSYQASIISSDCYTPADLRGKHIIIKGSTSSNANGIAASFINSMNGREQQQWENLEGRWR